MYIARIIIYEKNLVVDILEIDREVRDEVNMMKEAKIYREVHMRDWPKSPNICVKYEIWERHDAKS